MSMVISKAKYLYIHPRYLPLFRVVRERVRVGERNEGFTYPIRTTEILIPILCTLVLVHYYTTFAFLSDE